MTLPLYLPFNAYVSLLYCTELCPFRLAMARIVAYPRCYALGIGIGTASDASAAWNSAAFSALKRGKLM